MYTPDNLVLALTVIDRVSRIILKAVEEGRRIDEEELNEALDVKNEGMEDWHEFVEDWKQDIKTNNEDTDD